MSHFIPGRLASLATPTAGSAGTRSRQLLRRHCPQRNPISDL